MPLKIKNFLSAFLIAITATLWACAPDFDKSKADGRIAEEKVIVARVNGEPIYKSDVLRRMRAAYEGNIEELKSDPNRWQMLKDVATESEVMDQLLLQTAVAEGMVVSEDDAQGLLDRTKELAGSKAFAEMLKERGVDEETFRDFLVKRELILRYKNKLFKNVTVNDDALEEYYEGHKETFVDPPQVRLEIFTFGVRKTAEGIYKLWKDGDSFEAISAKYKNEGENVGRRTRWMPIDAIPAELQSKVTEADVGTILEPEQISNKFYVVKIIDKMESRTRGFEEVKAEIYETILNLRKNKVLDEWHKNAMQGAKIEYFH